jgi:formamidopyrimidine-DNA glycosylase
MPELPEVETVRRGLEEHAMGQRVIDVRFGHPRTLRRQPGGQREFRDRLVGRELGQPQRRGKYLWIPLDDGSALVAHLGMSGQFRIGEAAADGRLPVHAGAGLQLSGGTDLWFCDQRTFGWVVVEDLDEHGRPAATRHIAPDPFEAEYDRDAVARRLHRRRTEVKRALLDQELVSGVGNIYADEALWRTRLHGRRRTDALTVALARRLLDAAHEVMSEALAAGGTSFDALYVDVNGESGWFDRSLAVYGQEGEPCSRCGTPIRREAFANRSSWFCPVCQPAPRRRRSPVRAHP